MSRQLCQSTEGLYGKLFILYFAFAPILTFTALRLWLVPAVADEPTTHVPFYVHCVNYFMSWFHV